MMKLLFLFILLTFITNKENNDYFNNKEYFSLTRDQKMNKLWETITEDSTPGQWPPSIEGFQIMIEALEPTFEHNGDTFPKNRKKLIHSVGVIAKSKFVAIHESQYTGMMKGSSDLLIRLSVAKKPKTSEKTPESAYGNFIPGISLKFLRDGLQSTNIVAMKTVMGSPSWNFFEDDLTNNFEIPTDANFPLQLLSRRFIHMTSHISAMGLHELTSVDQFGKKEETPIFPFRLIFRPNQEIKNNYSKEYTEDYINQLRRIKAGSILYDVYAQGTPFCIEEKIGYIKLISDVIVSKFSDENLFFRHTLIDNDIKSKPAWTNYYDQFGWLGLYQGERVKVKSKCPFSDMLMKDEIKSKNVEL